MRSDTISNVAKAIRTVKLSRKDKVLAINLVTRVISGTKIQKIIHNRVKKNEKISRKVWKIQIFFLYLQMSSNLLITKQYNYEEKVYLRRLWIYL